MAYPRLATVRLSIRIPYVANPKGRRIETRFPDPLMNPYLGLGTAGWPAWMACRTRSTRARLADKNLYDLPPEEDARSRPCAWQPSTRPCPNTSTTTASSHGRAAAPLLQLHDRCLHRTEMEEVTRFRTGFTSSI
ncbi:hypothetical protein ACU4GD_40130 [Cupriavidus basilensis]